MSHHQIISGGTRGPVILSDGVYYFRVDAINYIEFDFQRDEVRAYVPEIYSAGGFGFTLDMRPEKLKHDLREHAATLGIFVSLDDTYWVPFTSIAGLWKVPPEVTSTASAQIGVRLCCGTVFFTHSQDGHKFDEVLKAWEKANARS